MGTQSCCSAGPGPEIQGEGQAQVRKVRLQQAHWTDGVVETPVGQVLRARTSLTCLDDIGTLKARSALGRMHYTVPPGLYAAGNPRPDGPVFVSANYKLSFDRLRSVLGGRDAWILVLDTKGINVWCAAGKGTFGTGELINRVKETRLDQVVSHRKLVVPQLGATGVSAHEVKAGCGFRVEYGPVRAEDLPAFLDAGMKVAPEMRRVRFGLRDRAVLVPVELVTGMTKALLVAAVFLLLGGVSLHGYSLQGVRDIGLPGAGFVLGAFIASALLGPLLLPWLPGRPFAVKGALLGAALAAVLAACGWLAGPSGSWLLASAWTLLIPAIASFVLMNFTGASTFTSLSGVLLEMRYAVPAQIVAAVIGCGLWIAGLLTSGRGAS